MADKVQKIKEWISKTQDGLMNAQGNFEYPEHEGAYDILCNLGAYIDSMQEEPKECMYSKGNYTDKERKVLCDGCEEDCKYNKKEEPVSERFAFKAIPRLLEMIKPTDRAKAYIAKLVDALEVEGYSTDAKIVMGSLKIMNGEKVPMATMDEEPVSDELEKVVEEIVDPTVLNAYGVKEIANRLRRTMIEPVSEELGDYINELSKQFPEVSFAKLSKIAVRVAKWQKEQIKKAMDLGEPPYLISIEQAYYRTLKLLEE